MSINDIKDKSAVQAAISEYDLLGRTYFLEKYGFSKSREYMIRDQESGRLYDSKAIVGAAYSYAFPDRPRLHAKDFSGGEATVERLLLGLGYEVVRVGQDWSVEEVLATVLDYFEMFDEEAAGNAYSKTEHSDRLRKQLRARSRASVELKHQNISAVLNELGLPWIKGYKPRGNYQALLKDVVTGYVLQQQAKLYKIVDKIEETVTPGEQKFRGVLVDVPVQPPIAPTKEKRKRLPRKLDFAGRDEHNRLLGRNGEEWVLDFERCRLSDEGAISLVEKIDWVSDRCGDGTGYDIMSFESDGVVRFIEVKTTNGGSLTPFIITRNELEFAEETEDAFCLYRVFDFRVSPRLFILRGAITQHVTLEALDYRARLNEVVTTNL